MTPHDSTSDGATSDNHAVPASLTAPIVPSSSATREHFDPVSLRPAIDAGSIERRLAELGASRSTAALGERADLLRILGRLDEALAIAEEAFRLAHFTGDRADSTAARIRRAYVFKEQGKLERALTDLHTSRISAATEEWYELEAAAAELEGYTLYELGRNEEARGSLTAALTAYEKAGAPAERINGLRVAIEGVMRAILQSPGQGGVRDDGVTDISSARRETGSIPGSVPGSVPGPTSGRAESVVTPVVVGATSPEAPARLSPDAANIDQDASGADAAHPASVSVDTATLHMAVPRTSGPGASRGDDEDRNEDDEPASGFDAEVSRARKAARSIWGAFDASKSKTPPTPRS